MSRFPLLGRDDELKLYRRLLFECLEVSKWWGKKAVGLEMLNHHNVLLVRGDARQGKTRLLNELVYCTQKDIPVNRFLLTNRDNKVPFQTIQLIFSKALGLNDSSTESNRQRKLISKLAGLNVPEVLCALNQVFSVHFEQTPFYLSLPQDKKQAVLQKLIKQLCVAVGLVF